MSTSAIKISSGSPAHGCEPKVEKNGKYVYYIFETSKDWADALVEGKLKFIVEMKDATDSYPVIKGQFGIMEPAQIKCVLGRSTLELVVPKGQSKECLMYHLSPNKEDITGDTIKDFEVIQSYLNIELQKACKILHPTLDCSPHNPTKIKLAIPQNTFPKKILAPGAETIEIPPEKFDLKKFIDLEGKLIITLKSGWFLHNSGGHDNVTYGSTFQLNRYKYRGLVATEEESKEEVTVQESEPKKRKA